MSNSVDLYIPVETTPKRILQKNSQRWSWQITNTSAAIVYYLRGRRGQNVAASGANQGVSIGIGDSDGYDDLDAEDEVWIIGASAVDVILGVTNKEEPAGGKT